MEKTLIVANFKENFTVTEARAWFDGLNKESRIKNKGNVEIVVCPPLVLIPVLHSSFIIHHSALHLGAQDVSKFEEGQYTGEVSAKMLKDFVDYVIVGHSERRKHFGETDEDVAKKSILALKYNLVPIVCVSNVEEARNWKLEARKETGSWKLDKAILAYEPTFAVGTSEPDTPENAQKFAEKIKTEIGQNVRVLYGGSVNSENVKSFVSQPDISGVLVGQAGLDAEEFTKIIKAA